MSIFQRSSILLRFQLTILSYDLGKIYMFRASSSLTYLQRLRSSFSRSYCSSFLLFDFPLLIYSFFSSILAYFFTSLFEFYFLSETVISFFGYFFSPGLVTLKESKLILDFSFSLPFSSSCYFCCDAILREFIFILLFSANPLDRLS